MKFSISLALATISGLCYCLAFPGFDVWPLAFVAWVPLLVALHGRTPKEALVLGLVMGTTTTFAGFYWLADMLRTFSGFPTVACLFFVFVISVYQAGQFTLTAWLYARASTRGYPAALAFACAFVASELVFPLLFPWYFGTAVYKVPVLAQTAELGGPILVGLVLVAANLTLAELVVARVAKRAVDRRLVGVTSGAFAVAVAFGAVRMPMVRRTMQEAETNEVGIVQGNMALIAKRENPNEGLKRHKRMTAELKERGADVVVWSESSVAFTVPEAMAPNFVRERIAGGLDVPLVFGGVVFRRGQSGGGGEKWFNTAFGTDAKGDIQGRYDKQFLLAFGEYLPFGDTFPILHEWSPNSGHFSKGTSLDPLRMTIDGKERVLSMLICYEDIIPSFTNALARHGHPDLLVNITNDAWFGDTVEPWEHLALATFRAIEHRRYLVRSTNSGVSAIVDPLGNIVAHTGTFKAETLLAPIRWLRTTTLFEIVGDVPWYGATIMALVMAFRRRKGTKDGGNEPPAPQTGTSTP
ncbi:MAG: apolipoprotein N-acyltransferase [Polyangiaceae bacterium]